MSLSDAKRLLQWRVIEEALKAAEIDAEVMAAVEHRYPNGVPITVGAGSRRKPGGVIKLPYLDGVQHAAFPIVTEKR